MTNDSDHFICTFNNNGQPIQQMTQIGTEQPTVPYLIDKIADVALKHEGSALIFSNGIATSIIIYMIAKSAAEIIKAWRSTAS